MGAYRRWTKDTIRRQLQILKNKIDLRVTGTIEFWAVRFNCDRSGCYRRYGFRHAHHGHIYTFKTEQQARTFLAQSWHDGDLLHRVVMIPAWEILNPTPDHGLETTDLTDLTGT
jgi:hypothetical protein